MVKTKNAVPAQTVRQPVTPPDASLPNATVIYGVGASFMFVATAFLLMNGRWFSALGVLALGLCLVGFALHLLKHK